MPRQDKDSANVQTDIYALGSTIYHIITGHRLFPQLHTIDDKAELIDRFRNGHFPVLQADVGGNVVCKCWEGGYSSANEAVADLAMLQESPPKSEKQ